ncbi:MAG: 3-dehydroquinate synthase [Myxococcota bacterium]|jgi:3-dehydroquinate synthase|nr:3-dehydroquinate synthase [Myxococcota bacterium]
MATVRIELPHHAYDIRIEPGGLQELGASVRALAPHGQCGLVADPVVRDLYGDSVEASLLEAGYGVVSAQAGAGEEAKNLASVEGIYQVLLEARLERRSPVIALGGGITGDVAGFVAATYLRGVPFIQCPTTLLAMVDSSVGGKTGVNVAQGKNLIGAFYQPDLVVADPLVLNSLPPRELRCGLAECVKHAVIRDESLFGFIGDHHKEILALSSDEVVELVRRNVEIKAAVVMEDEREGGVRAHLNFGHTFGHAIESTVGYGAILHGEAVGLGMLAAARAAAEFGLCSSELPGTIAELLSAIGLPIRADLPDNRSLGRAMRHDKKVENDLIRFVLPRALGQVEIRDDLPDTCVDAGWEFIRA